jgi:thioredoxin 1
MTVINLTKENFEKEVRNSEIPVIVDFWAPWCAPCLMMKPNFEEISEDFEGTLKFAKLNTDEEPGIASQFDIMGIPCLIIMEKGEEKDRIVGLLPKEILKEKINSILD